MRKLMGGNPTTFAGSDHGFAPAYYAVNANAGAERRDRDSTSGTSRCTRATANASNCGAATTDIAKACWAGGTIQIYINSTLPAGTHQRGRCGLPSKTAFQNLTDPAHPGAQVVLRIMDKEELRNVDGSDSLHPNRSGDVVVVLRSPYQADAGANGAGGLAVPLLRAARLPAEHRRPPEQHQHARDVRVRRARASRTSRASRCGMRAIDFAPTIAFLMNIPGPQNARGRIRYDIVEHAEQPPGSHDPRHQRLPRAADPAGRRGRHDLVAPATAPRRSTSAAPRTSRSTSRPTRRSRRSPATKQAGVIEMAGRRLGRRDTADLGVLRRPADDRRS